MAEKTPLSRDIRLAINQETKDTDHRCFQGKLTKRTTSMPSGAASTVKSKTYLKNFFSSYGIRSPNRKIDLLVPDENDNPRSQRPHALIVADGSCSNICDLLATSPSSVLWLHGDKHPFDIISQELVRHRERATQYRPCTWSAMGEQDGLHWVATPSTSSR